MLFRHPDIQHTKSMCSIYIHPSLILCVRKIRMALCAWRTITKTHGEEFISRSFTQTHTHSQAGWLAVSVWIILPIVQCSLYMLIHIDTPNPNERGWFSKQEHFWGRLLLFLYIRSIVYNEFDGSNNGNFAEFFSIYFLLVCLCVWESEFFCCVFSFVITLCLTRAILFCEPVLIYVFRRTSFALRFIKYVYGMIIISLISYLTTDQLHIYEFILIEEKLAEFLLDWR